MSLTAQRIFNGETAEQLSMSQAEYDSRKETLAEFLRQWDRKGDFERAYIAWLLERTASTRKAEPLPTPPPIEECCPPLPSAAQQAKNFIGEAGRFIASGFVFAEKELVAKRVQICDDCQYLIGRERCSLCGCFMKLKAKLGSSSCPAKKW